MFRDETRSAKDLVGKILHGRYRLLELLGEGGMGAVYRAEHVHLETIRAIKILLPRHAKDASLIKRFHREARGLSRLNHPNVVSVVDTGETEDGLPFIAMEYLEGEPLKQTLKHGPLPWPVVKHIARQVCHALHAAHEAGLIHRDVKPDNCFRVNDTTDDYRIKLLDFGIAKLQTEQTSHLTETGSAIGTLPYMSYEQICGHPCNHQTDIWSAAAMFYQMLTGFLPFRGTNPGQLSYAIVQGDPKPVSHVRPELNLPSALDPIFARAMAKDTATRYPTMLALFEALDSVPDSGSTIPTTLLPSASPTPPVATDQQTNPWPGSMQSDHPGDVDELLKNSEITLDKKISLPVSPPTISRHLLYLLIVLGALVPLTLWLALRSSSDEGHVVAASVPEKSTPANQEGSDDTFVLTPKSESLPLGLGDDGHAQGETLDTVVSETPETPDKTDEASGTSNSVQPETPDKTGESEGATNESLGSTDPSQSDTPAEPKPKPKKSAKKDTEPPKPKTPPRTSCGKLKKSPSIRRCLQDCDTCNLPVKVVAKRNSLIILGPSKSATTTGGKSITECANHAIKSMPPLDLDGVCKLSQS